MDENQNPKPGLLSPLPVFFLLGTDVPIQTPPTLFSATHSFFLTSHPALNTHRIALLSSRDALSLSLSFSSLLLASVTNLLYNWAPLVTGSRSISISRFTCRYLSIPQYNSIDVTFSQKGNCELSFRSESIDLCKTGT